MTFITYAQTTIIVHTKFGTPIEGIITPEFSEEEKDSHTEFISETFPNATILSESTHTYNCHSYAWNMTEGGPTCWINYKTIDNANNISKYWLMNEFYSTSPNGNILKIYYYNADHSAVPSDTTPSKYISKWGNYPLMLHDPDYNPYGTEKQYFYKRLYSNDLLKCSIWNRGVHINEIANYYIPYDNTINKPLGNMLDYRWSIIDCRAYENVIGTKATITANGSNADIAFSQPGLYIITCDIYSRDGEFISSYTIEGVVEN